MNKAREYKLSDIKRLFTLASNECSWPGCCRKLVAEDKLTLIGKICHISAASENGPRWNEDMTDDERRSFDNLILLCDEHHQIIDNPVNTKKYTVQLLRKWKKDHESRDSKALNEITDQEIERFFDQFSVLTSLTENTNQVVLKSASDLQSLNDKVDSIETLMKVGFAKLSGQENFPNNQGAIDHFIENNLGPVYDWTDPYKTKTFEKIIADFNKEVKDKRTKFVLSQNVTRSIFRVSELKEYVKAWNKDAMTPENLDHLRFIQAGIMAYESLERIPDEILNDLRKLNFCPIHGAFYAGHLGGFVRELKFYWQEMKVDMVEKYHKDSYMFENLKRIIESLKRFLEFDVNELYAEKARAKIIKDLPNRFLIVITSKSLSVRHDRDCNQVLASLPLNQQFRVSKVQFIFFKGNPIVVSFTSQDCFYWGPQSDIDSTTFYMAHGDERILDVFVEATSTGRVSCYVQASSGIKWFIDFEETERYPFNASFILHRVTNGFISCSGLFQQNTGPVLFQVSKDFDLKPLMTIERLKGITRNEEAIKKWLNEIEFGRNELLKEFNDLRNILVFTLPPLEGCDMLIIRGVMERTGVLMLAKLIENEIDILNIIHLKNSSVVALDAKIIEGSLHICAGYLDMNRNDAVFELLKFSKSGMLESSQTIERGRDGHDCRDILDICFGTNDLVYLSEVGKKLLVYDSAKEAFLEFITQNDETISHLQFIDTDEFRS